MADHRHAWLAAPNVRWGWVLAASVLWGALLLIAYKSGLGPYLESKLARPLEFQVREAVGRSPTLSPKLKIYALDDSTFAKLGNWVLSLDEWSQILAALAVKEPRAIVIDAMFSTSSTADEDPVENAAALARLRALPVPIVVGSFVTPQPIRYRDPLNLQRADYNLNEMREIGPSGAALPPLVDRPQWYAYGPAPSLAPLFQHIGHFQYAGNGLVAPFIRLGHDAAVPHLSLYVARERRFQYGQLVVDGHTVPIDPSGHVTVNFLPPGKLYEATRSLRGLIQLALEGRASSVVEKDDVVLIVPQMFTGHTDFKQTPFGAAPGGFVVASMLNSVLTGEWLKPVVGGDALIFVLAILGALLGMKASVIVFWVVCVFVGLSIVGASLALFAWNGILVPWLFPLAGFVGASLLVFAEKTRVGEKKTRALRQALEGAVAPGDLTQLLKHPERVTFEARERVVTLMFIDVVGFSLLAENMLPRMAFENLKRLLTTISETIHSFGGIIDKTLGDGLLCYFGYRFDDDTASSDHAEQALRCAIKIQRENLRRNLEAAASGEAVYPLRIGINTASCYLGDLGTGNRIDFTVVGNGVNFAKRLEGASDIHAILFGSTTYDLVKGLGLSEAAITKRFIRIKHHSELVEAYEYDPFHAEPELRAAAREAFRKGANIRRIDHRWPVHDPSRIQLTCDFGDGRLVNFSHNGLSLRLRRALARGTHITMTLDGAGGALRRLLAKEGIEVLQGEVRWGYADGSEYVHGVLITNLNERQSDALVQYLCEVAFAHDLGLADGGDEVAS